MNAGLLLITVTLASAVEMVEAMTIILASGISRGWRSTLVGTAAALVLLTLIVVAFGPTLVKVDIDVLRIVVGTLLIMFGLQWLRKAILRAGGYWRQRDEAAIFNNQVTALSKAPGLLSGKFDPVAFTITFKGVFLEGLEVVMIVITFGLAASKDATIAVFGVTARGLTISAVAAAAAALIVGVVGAALAQPLAKVPENMMKMGVGLLLTSFGAFWMGEGAGIEWPGADAFLLVLLGVLGLATFALIGYLKRSKQLARLEVGT